MVNTQVDQPIRPITVRIGLASGVMIDAVSEDGDSLLDVLQAAVKHVPGAASVMHTGKDGIVALNGNVVIFGASGTRKATTVQEPVHGGETVIVGQVKDNG
jgi:hypothetical protein